MDSGTPHGSSYCEGNDGTVKCFSNMCAIQLREIINSCWLPVLGRHISQVEDIRACLALAHIERYEKAIEYISRCLAKLPIRGERTVKNELIARRINRCVSNTGLNWSPL